MNDLYLCAHYGFDLQRNSLNEPDKRILKYWKPETNLEDGIKSIIDKMGKK
jgi:hypothetical protein